MTHDFNKALERIAAAKNREQCAVIYAEQIIAGRARGASTGDVCWEIMSAALRRRYVATSLDRLERRAWHLVKEMDAAATAAPAVPLAASPAPEDTAREDRKEA